MLSPVQKTFLTFHQSVSQQAFDIFLDITVNSHLCTTLLSPAGAVCFIKESSVPQNQRVQKVMSQRSAGSCTRCTRANYSIVKDSSADLGVNS